MEPAVLRRRDVEKKIGVSKATLHRWVRDGQFPRPIRLGVRAVAWRAEEIEAWLASRNRA